MQFYRTTSIIHTNWGDSQQFHSLYLIKFNSETGKGIIFISFF